MRDIEITKRELIVCVIISLILLAGGFLLSNKILESSVDQEKVYATAIKIREKAEYDYSLKTQQGNIMVSASFTAIDPVSFDEIDGEYAYVSKTKEVYTMHTREVAEYDSDGKLKGYRTEVYWTWDYYGTEEKQSNTLSFYENQYDSSLFSLIPTSSYGDYYYERSDVRYYYRVVPKTFEASFIAKTAEDGIKPINSKKIELSTRTLDEMITHGKNIVRTNTIYFWIFWILIIIAVNLGFVYFDNKYLEG
ncbi:hypothetical protein [Enterococcus sp. LJL90]